ncbi:hypothetical protein [Chitinibacter sp. GC72]|uniref:hypothetical protein n=1 Tax=Chitinibacter sp. GC72 TaxID=1526917 RepID=UPI0012FBFC28|nr:hypothetical protein [Chitinibacter sp. GC72]
MSKSALDEEGLRLESSEGRLSTITVETGTNKRTGEVYETQRTGIKVSGSDGRTHWFAPDAGFNSNPGVQRYQPDLDKYDYHDARQYVADTLRGADFEGWYKDLATVVERGLAEGGSSTELRQVLAARQRFPVAVLDADGMDKLGSQSQTVWLSDDTLAKQLVHRQGQAVGLEDYWRVQQVLEAPQMIIADRDLHLKFIRQDDKWWVAVVKVTRTGKENYLQSFYITTEKEVRRLMRNSANVEGNI